MAPFRSLSRDDEVMGAGPEEFLEIERTQAAHMQTLVWEFGSSLTGTRTENSWRTRRKLTTLQLLSWEP